MTHISCLKITGDTASFWCPGCDEPHSVKISGSGTWGYNGNALAPTFEHSVLSTNGHFSEGHARTDECWCTYNQANPDEELPFKCTRCHAFVRDGMIEFLSDCSHSLANETVPLIPYPER